MKQFLIVRKVQLTAVIILQSMFTHSQILDIEWLNSTGGTEHDNYVGSVLDNSGNVYALGAFRATMDIDPGSAVNTVTSVGEYDIYVQKFDSNGDLIWGYSFGGGGLDRPKEIALDAAGNSYIVGGFNGFVDFDPGFGVTSLIASGMSDGFVLKLNSDGNFQWVKQIEGAGNILINSVTVDNADDVIISGIFEGTVDLDPSSLNVNHTSNGSSDICIVKLDSNGEYLWATTIGGAGYDSSSDIITDNLGNIYHSGLFNETVDFSDNGTVILTEFGTVSSDGYVNKVSSMGDFMWVKQIRGESFVDASSITLDDDANVIVLGRFSDTLRVDLDGTDSLLISGGAGIRNVYAQKLDSAGGFQWIKQFTSDVNNKGYSIVSSQNAIYIAGSFNGITDFDPMVGSQDLTPVGVGGFSDGFYLKLNQNGGLEWVSQFGSVEGDRAETIEVNANGKEIYVAGTFSNITDFYSGTTTSQLTSNGATDACVFKLNDVTEIFENNQNEVRIYPNPSEGIVTVEMEVNEMYEIQLLDSKGSILISIGDLNGVNEINIEKYESGVYFVLLSNEKGTIVQKMIKQ